MVVGLMDLHRFVGNKDILLIGNKADILPKSINPNRLINWMKAEAVKLGLKPVDVLLVSAHKGQGMEEALAAIDTISPWQRCLCRRLYECREIDVHQSDY